MVVTYTLVSIRKLIDFASHFGRHFMKPVRHLISFFILILLRPGIQMKSTGVLDHISAVCAE